MEGGGGQGNETPLFPTVEEPFAYVRNCGRWDMRSSDLNREEQGIESESPEALLSASSTLQLFLGKKLDPESKKTFLDESLY